MGCSPSGLPQHPAFTLFAILSMHCVLTFTFLSPSQESELLEVRDYMLFTVSDIDGFSDYLLEEKHEADLFQAVKAKGLLTFPP